ncbi:unnamed protein product [Ectocarpus sp. CCAP 1310/34]|nr:unnamed protein product [Ectocarpus sp. CCAP 1310/34]
MSSNLPQVDLGGNTVLQVAAGQSHTCVLLASGDVACWGFNEYGQLGLGDTQHRGTSSSDMGEGLAVVDLGTGRTATHIACGQYHTCAILDIGSLKCWGRNNYGALGLGDTDDRGQTNDTMGDQLPSVDLGTGHTALAVAAGRHHTCAILNNEALKCWGAKNDTMTNYGQLGQGNTDGIGTAPGQMGDNLPEVDLGTNRTAVALETGWYHTCVILDNKELHCFGRNFDGQLGQGDDEDRGCKAEQMGDDMVAVDLGEGRHPVAVAAGRWHTCVLMDNDEVKCFGANTAEDLGGGQLGLEDTINRGGSLDTIGDNLPPVDLGTGRVAGWVFAGFDHTCVIFEDSSLKCWGLNASGQLGLEDTDDRGADIETMGVDLAAIELGGLEVAIPPSPVFDADDDDDGEVVVGDDEVLSTEWIIAIALTGVAGAIVAVGIMFLCCCRRLGRQGGKSGFCKKMNPFVTTSGTHHEAGHRTGGGDDARGLEDFAAFGPTDMVGAMRNTHPPNHGGQTPGDETHSVSLSGSEVRVGAVVSAGATIAGGMALGLNMVGVLAESLPWIGVACHMLNHIADSVDTRDAMQGNMAKIKSWAICLRDVLVQMSRQMQTQPTVNARALQHMSTDVMSSLQTLVDTVASYNAKGTLAQYACSRSCQRAVDAADTALRGALTKLSVGQGAELITMVGRLQGVGLVVDEKLDMIIEQLRKQEENAAKMELSLAKYSASMAEVLGRVSSVGSPSGDGKERPRSNGKTLRELGKEQLDKLQISKEDVTYASKRPFASGSYSEVYQVIHEGVVKAAKKTNLARLGVGKKDIDRVFERFVKELYILSQMHSDRVVSMYGAIASPTELTLVMEFLERGSIRTILDDDRQRQSMTPVARHGLLLDTAEGMAYLYKNGVQHRDLKSANCLVTHDWRVKISDFGLSKTIDAISTGSTSTMSGNFRGGTMTYMAPELLPGGAGGDVPAELSDAYSFGVVVWDVVCGEGRTPWAGVRIYDLPSLLRKGERLDIPVECGRFYRRLMVSCWNKDPHRRPTFDSILKDTRKEADRPFSAALASSLPTDAPAHAAATGIMPAWGQQRHPRAGVIASVQRARSQPVTSLPAPDIASGGRGSTVPKTSGQAATESGVGSVSVGSAVPGSRVRESSHGRGGGKARTGASQASGRRASRGARVVALPQPRRVQFVHGFRLAGENGEA